MSIRKGRLTSSGVLAAPVNFPTGSVLDFAGDTAPNGWLLCYGQAVSRTDYASLFATLGTTYGSGDGSTTFNLPDYRGRVLVGKDNMGGSAAGRITSALSGITGTTLGAAGGAQTHPLATNEVGAHSHSASSAQAGSHSHTQNIPNQSYNLNTTPLRPVGTDVTGSETTHTLMNDNGNHSHSITVSSNAASVGHQNTQPSIITNKIIKV